MSSGPSIKRLPTSSQQIGARHFLPYKRSPIGPWGTFGDPGQPRPTGFQFARENLQSRVIEEEDTITNHENAGFALSRSESSRRLDHEVRLVHSVELSCDHPQLEHQNLYV
ncbi:hypothetical protein Tco_0259277 [Tanacetum coccineum]